ncbi:hypothetical protein [uncultured Bacteroides sp.]|jgi:hypothetical protein|uniref:hypothetical protein n=1 Tax=uncultured Bacteroides sp. TaxID=162156 RepID=UPI00280AD13F|nr:hypothetical protein [uncultured Bacteroides sp.]
MFIDCDKCSSKTGCGYLANGDFSKCWQYREVVREKKEKIAIEAMKAILSNSSVVTGVSDEGPKIIANVSVMIADEMIKQLNDIPK